MKFSLFLFSFLILVLSLSLVSALDGFGIDDNELPKLNREVVAAVDVNYSLVPTVNSSDWWDDRDTINTTQMETSSGGILSITASWLTNFGNDLWCRLTGCEMTGDINMTGNNITNVNWLTAEYINVTEDLYVNNDSLWIGGVEFSASGDTVYINGTVNVQTINVTVNVSGINELTVITNLTVEGDTWCNATSCYTLQQFLTVGNVTDTQKNTNGFYLYNDTTTIFFNETQLNDTIDARGTGDNSSWNQSLADTLYWDINLGSYNATYDAFTDTQKATTDFYLYNDTTIIYFNETQLNATIDNKIAPVIYNASLIINISGILDVGDITSIQQVNDGDTYNVSEVTGANPSNIQVNFTGVNNFNTILFRGQYLGGAGHEIEICLYDYTLGNYKCEYPPNIVTLDNFAFGRRDVFDDSDHISGGVVSLQFNHIQTGNVNHDFFLDYVVLVEGASAITGEETDPFFDIYLNESINQTQFEYEYEGGGVLNILESWLTTFWDAIWGTKTTDDLTEGSTNLYDNQSWNESYADTKYGVGYGDIFVNETGDTMTGNLNMSNVNVTDIDCIIFNSGGRICGG